jgi:hypothetical protein
MFPARRIDDDSTGVRLGDLNDAGDVLRQFYLRAPPDLSLCARLPEGEEKTGERPGVFS